MDVNIFFQTLIHYIIDVLPAIAVGFLISGLVHEFMPEDFVNKYLAKKNFSSIFWASLIGVILPVCCLGTLPVAISFHRKGARLGPILAFMVATPATSITALFVCYRLLGLKFTVYIFFAAILLGVIIGLVGNMFTVPIKQEEKEKCSTCGEIGMGHEHAKAALFTRIKSVLVYAFWKMPKDIGKEILIGLVLAALITSIAPIEKLISLYFGGVFGYVFALIFGIFMYICSTGAVPLVHAFANAGMNIGAAMLLLLAGPITSFGTLLVIRKQFGMKILYVYLAVISVSALIVSFIFSLL